MSSSDPRAFLRMFAVCALVMATLALGLTWAVDPSAILARSGGGWLCAPGIKGGDPHRFKQLAAAIHQPEEILLGSSRAAAGFAEADFRTATGRSAANLALAGASLAEMDALARSAIARAPVKRVWIGLDFGAFAQPPHHPAPVAPLPDLAGEPLALATGLFDPRATQAAIEAILTGSCARPPMTPTGFANADAAMIATPYSGFTPRNQARLTRAWNVPAPLRARSYADATQRLNSLAAFLRENGVEFIVYLAPVHPDYRADIARAGLVPLYRQWRQDVARIARAQGAVLVASDRPDFLDQVDAPCASRNACLFYDPLHFRPVVGRAILAEGLRLTAPDAPRSRTAPPDR